MMAAIDDSSAKCMRCLKHYDDPRMLPCLHSFCKGCVVQLAVRGSNKTVCCPKCHSTTSLLEKGVDMFPRNVQLSYEATTKKFEAQIKSEPPPSCGECRREPPLETVSFCCTCHSFLCKECHTQHILSQKLSLNHLILLLNETSGIDVGETLKRHMKQPPITCSQHPERNIEFFCTDCSVLVCVQCALIQHRGHEFEEHNSLSQKKRVEIKESVQAMPDSIAKLEEAIAKGKGMKKTLKTSKETVDTQIRKAFKELREEIDKQESALLAKSSEISTSKDTSLTLQLEELTTLKDQMVVCSTVVGEVQEHYNDTELLSVVTTIQTRIQDLVQKFENISFELRDDDKISLAIDMTALRSEISKCGTVKRHQRLNQETIQVWGSH